MRWRVGWVALLTACMCTQGPRAQGQESPPQRLTMNDAIALALKQNLSVRVASAQINELAGTRARRLAPLLPHATADALANRQNIDLGAMGISFPHIPTVVPAFGHYDFRASASQALIDRRAIWQRFADAIGGLFADTTHAAIRSHR